MTVKGRDMRSAARKDDEPLPAPDLDAQAGVALAELGEMTARAQALLRTLPATAGSQETVAALRQLILVSINCGSHCEEMREAMADYGASREALEAAYARGRARERALAAEAARAVPRQQGRHASAAWRTGPIMRVVKVLAPVAAAAALVRDLLRHSAAAHAIGAHASLKIAAYVTAGAVTAAGVTGVAVVGAHVLGAGASQAGSYAGSVANPGPSDAASPIPTSSLITVTRPRTGTADARRARLAQGGILPVLPQPSASWTFPSSQPSGPSQPSASVSSSPAGPAVLGGVPTAIDLSGGAPVTITITASGGGFIAWKVSTTGTDLVFSKTGGVLAAGQSYQLTVSLAAPLDGNATQVFDVNGQQVTVTLPAPAVAPVPSPAVTGSAAPSPVPTSS